jgi:hypothetical protein
MSKQARFLQRPTVTAVVTASFVVVALTGVLMLFHVENGMIKEFHEGISILFVLAAGVHLALNWGSFTSYLRKPLTITLGIVVAVLIVLMFTGGQEGGHGGRPPFMEIARRIEAVSLAQASPLLGTNAEQSLTLLRGQGLRVESENDRIAEIARNNGKRADEILTLLMGSDEQRRDH